jgi:hypothetical protein
LFIFLYNFVLNASGSDEKPISQVRQETPAAMCVSVHTCALLMSDFNEDWRIVDKLLLSLPITKTTLLRPLIPKEGGSNLLRNVRNYLPHCTIHLKRLESFFANNQLDVQFFFMYVYFYSLHVSGSHVPIIRRINCINTTSGICHCV